jgi:hypothetical protein
MLGFVELTHLPCNLVSFGIVLQSDGEVTALIELAEAGWGHTAWLERSSVRGAGNLPHARNNRSSIHTEKQCNTIKIARTTTSMAITPISLAFMFCNI